MPRIKRIDHIALLVDDIENTLAFWRDLLGMEMSHTAEVPAEESLVAFLSLGESEIELVQPTTTDSGLARFLEKRGPGLHHVCLEVDGIEAMLERLNEAGIHLINKKPVINPDGRMYAFIHPKSANGVLVELYEQPEESGQ